MIFTILPLVLVCVYARAAEVCFSNIGCFQNTTPYNNTMGKLPKSPDDIRTSFTLHTRDNNTVQLDASNSSSISSSDFKPQQKTIFIVHGFHSRNTSQWIKPLADAFMTQGEMNIIVVDWSGGAFDPYDQAVANTRVVGAVIAELVKRLHNVTNTEYSNVYLVGHSLGAHICGYAGERLPGLGRITGLDPAGPFFQYTDSAVRIDSTDADFVDIIHTDGTRYGLNEAVGDVDFYPNGGVHQPACLSDHLDPSIACSHVRAIYYFIESLNSSCHYKSFPCKTKDDFDSDKCNSCGSGCQEMGYKAHRNVSGTFYLKTRWHYPYCSHS
ncbi:inactive pancreatic lipase-related protein 1-like [Mytilus galloprovincialis]|uniref:inactive pancreatic lipase-related protein 1-like n=1 Tax=Mytilus galloprovincialis TaxID=29158 RepID=UPI003F7C7F30